MSRESLLINGRHYQAGKVERVFNKLSKQELNSIERVFTYLTKIDPETLLFHFCLETTLPRLSPTNLSGSQNNGVHSKKIRFIFIPLRSTKPQWIMVRGGRQGVSRLILATVLSRGITDLRRQYASGNKLLQVFQLNSTINYNSEEVNFIETWVWNLYVDKQIT